MYNGEVNVEQANLTPFLSLAERLRVRGLCQDELLNADDKSSKDAASAKTQQQSSSNTSPSVKTSRSIIFEAPGACNSDAGGGRSASPPSKRAKLTNSSLPSLSGGGRGGAGKLNDHRSVITRTEQSTEDDDIEGW